MARRCEGPGCDKPAAPYSGKGPVPRYCSALCRYKAYRKTPEGREACQRATNRYKGQRRAARKQAGLCVVCDTPVSEINTQYCEEHRQQRNERHRRRRQKASIEASIAHLRSLGYTVELITNEKGEGNA